MNSGTIILFYFNLLFICVISLGNNSQAKAQKPKMHTDATKRSISANKIGLDSSIVATHPESLISRETQSGEYNFSSSQKRAISKLLKRNPSWRIALDIDNRDSTGGLKQYQAENPGYKPYFVQGSFDDVRGFSIALINSKNIYAVVWFTEKNDGTYPSSPQWITRNGDLSIGGLQIQQGELWLCGCFYCDNVVSFVWDTYGKMFVKSD